MTLKALLFVYLALCFAVDAMSLGESSSQKQNLVWSDHQDLISFRNLIFPEALKNLEKKNKLPCCASQTTSHTPVQKRDKETDLVKIGAGFKEILDEIPRYYVRGKINIATYRREYAQMEKRAIDLLITFIYGDFVESSGREKVCETSRRVSDEFEKLVNAYHEAVPPANKN